METDETRKAFPELVSAIENLDSLVEETKKLKKWSDMEKTISKIVQIQQTALKEILEIRKTLKKKNSKGGSTRL